MINPILLRILIFIRPHQFLIRLYSSSWFYDLTKDLAVDEAAGVIEVAAGYGKNLKILIWYDNEAGYSARVVDMLKKLM